MALTTECSRDSIHSVTVHCIHYKIHNSSSPPLSPYYSSSSQNSLPRMFISSLISVNFLYPALVLFEQENCIDWIYFCYVLSLIKKIALSDTPVELSEPNCISSSLPVDRKNQKGQSRDNYIILLFNSKYKRQ